MSESILIALIASVPAVIVAAFGFLSNLLPGSISFSHERLRRYESARQEAVAEYCTALGNLLRFPRQIANLDDQRVLKYKLQQRYFAAMHKAAAYVSPETYKMMAAVDDPLSFEPGSIQIIDLMVVLNAEITPRRRGRAAVRQTLHSKGSSR